MLRKDLEESLAMVRQLISSLENKGVITDDGGYMYSGKDVAVMVDKLVRLKRRLKWELLDMDKKE